MKYVLSTFRDNVENVRSGDSIDSVLSAGASDCRGTDLCVLYADNHDFGYSRRTLAVFNGCDIINTRDFFAGRVA